MTISVSKGRARSTCKQAPCGAILQQGCGTVLAACGVFPADIYHIRAQHSRLFAPFTHIQIIGELCRSFSRGGIYDMVQARRT